MTTDETTSVIDGTHWLCHLADELGKNARDEIDRLKAWDLPAGEVALAIMQGAFPNHVTRESKVILKTWPWEKSSMIRAAGGTPLEEWARPILIEAAMKELSNRADAR